MTKQAMSKGFPQSHMLNVTTSQYNVHILIHLFWIPCWAMSTAQKELNISLITTDTAGFELCLVQRCLVSGDKSCLDEIFEA